MVPNGMGNMSNHTHMHTHYGGPGGRATKHCTTSGFLIEQYSDGPIPCSSNGAAVRFRVRAMEQRSDSVFEQWSSGPILRSIPFRDQTIIHFRYRAN